MPRLGYLPALDGLRGSAILLVFSYHCFGWPQGGNLGVDLFFILSGFLITTLLLEEQDATGWIAVSHFYGRRARRLLPALALLLGAYLAIDAAKGHNGLKVVALGGLYIGNVIQAFGSSHGILHHSGLDHLWSLAEEEQFYLLWPIALPFLVRRQRPVRMLAILVGFLIVYRIGLAFAGAPHNRLYNGPDTHMDGLIAGSAFAFLVARRPQFVASRLLAVVAGAVLFEALLIRPIASGWDAFLLPFIEGAGVVILSAAVTLPGWSRALSAAPLVWFGRISYSLYLWHFMLIWAFNGQHRLIAAALSIAIAYGSTRWVEEPIRTRRRSAGISVKPAFVD